MIELQEHKKTFRILLIDDEPFVLSALKRILQTKGYEVYMSTDVFAAVSILQSIDIDLLISDKSMPGMDGLDLLRIVRNRYSHIPRVLLTGDFNEWDVKDAVASGLVQKLLYKPWNNDVLLKIVESCLE